MIGAVSTYDPSTGAMAVDVLRAQGAGSGDTWMVSLSGPPGSDANVTEAAVLDALGFTPEDEANRGQPNGYAALDEDGLVPSEQLPPAQNIPAKASAAEVRALSNDANFLTPLGVGQAAAYQTQPLTSTITLNLVNGLNWTFTLTGNVTLGAPTNAKPGVGGYILFKQDGTGGRTLAFNSAWVPFGATPSISTAANSVSLIAYVPETSGKIRFNLLSGGAA